MSADNALALIGGALLAVLSWMAIMLFGLRERVSVLATRVNETDKAKYESDKKRDDTIAGLRKARHEHANMLTEHEMRLAGVEGDVKDHDVRIRALEEV